MGHLRDENHLIDVHLAEMWAPEKENKKEDEDKKEEEENNDEEEKVTNDKGLLII